MDGQGLPPQEKCPFDLLSSVGCCLGVKLSKFLGRDRLHSSSSSGLVRPASGTSSPHQPTLPADPEIPRRAPPAILRADLLQEDRGEHVLLLRRQPGSRGDRGGEGLCHRSGLRWEPGESGSTVCRPAQLLGAHRVGGTRTAPMAWRAVCVKARTSTLSTGCLPAALTLAGAHQPAEAGSLAFLPWHAPLPCAAAISRSSPICPRRCDRPLLSPSLGHLWCASPGRSTRGASICQATSETEPPGARPGITSINPD